jgi:hypothetical protein
MFAPIDCPFVDAVIDGFRDQRSWRTGRREQGALHRRYPLLAGVAPLLRRSALYTPVQRHMMPSSEDN